MEDGKQGEEIPEQPTEELNDDLKRKRDGDDIDIPLPASIEVWIQSLELAAATAAECIKAFNDNEIAIEQVLSLTASDLKDLGITKLGPRKKILDAIEQMKSAKRPKKEVSIEQPPPVESVPQLEPEAVAPQPIDQSEPVQSVVPAIEPVQEGKVAIETPLATRKKRQEGDFPGSDWEQQLAKAHPAQVVLNPLDADPDFRWTFQDDYFHVHTLSINKFVFLWTGGKGSRGVRGGKYWFELQVSEIFENADIREHASWSGLPKHGFRVGWSTSDTAPGSLGDDSSSFAIDHTGHKWFKEISSFGQGYAVGDIVGCYLDTIAWTISFAKNSAFPTVAFTIPQHLRGQTFYPHVLLKNMRCKLNFGLKPPITKRAPGYEVLERAHPGHYVNATLPHLAKSECQLYAIIRFPHAEKSRWQAEFLKQNLDKHYYVLSGDALVSRIKSWLASPVRQKGNVPNRLNSVATALLNSMFSLVPKEAPRNYLIDLTGNGPAGRRDKLKHFEGFGKRTAVCIVPTLAQRKKHADFDVAKSTLVLPVADGKEFDAVLFPEGSLEDANKILSEIERKSTAKEKAQKPTIISPREPKRQRGGQRGRGFKLPQLKPSTPLLTPSPIRRGFMRAAQGKGFSPFAAPPGLSPATAIRVPRVQLPIQVPIMPALTSIRTPNRDNLRPLLRDEIRPSLLPEQSWNKPLLPTPEPDRKWRESHDRAQTHERDRDARGKRNHDRDVRAKRDRERDRERDRDHDYLRDREREEYGRDRLLERSSRIVKEDSFARESEFDEHRETQRPSQLLSLYGPRGGTPPPPPPPPAISDYPRRPELSNSEVYRSDHLLESHHGRNEFEPPPASYSDRPYMDLPSKRFNDIDMGFRGESLRSESSRGLSSMPLSGLSSLSNNSGRNIGGSSLLGGIGGGGGFPTPGIAALQNALLPNLSSLGGLPNIGLGGLPLSRGKGGKIDIRAADVRFAAAGSSGKQGRTRFGPPKSFS